MLTAEQVRRLLKREQNGDTQKDFANKIGVSPPHLCDVLAGKREPSGKVLEYLKLERIVGYARTPL